MKTLRAAVAGIAALLCVAGTSQAREMVQIKGSDTLINLVQREAEEYMAQNRGTAIAVTGDGSGTGIAALLNGSCDIANASRLMKTKEVMQATGHGIQPKRIVVAIDALSVITNGSNPVEKLTMDQIGKIYRGEITNWKDVGGNDQPITLYGRQPNSGTYDFMKEFVLEGEYSGKMRQMNGNAQIVEAVKQDATGIGYVGIGYAAQASGIHLLKVALKQGGDYIDPSNKANVDNGTYPIARPLNQYVNGTPSGAVKDFLMFELGQAGQQIVVDEGFYAVPDEYKKHNAEILGI